MTEDENEIALKAAIEDFVNQSVTQGVTVAEAKAMARQAIERAFGQIVAERRRSFKIVSKP